jgi:sugar lactone lactonase YvrE
VENSTLIISESFGGRLTAFDIGADGGLSNRRVWADNLGPDGICLDADGAVWTQAADTRTRTGRADSAEGACVRVEEGGAVLRRIEHDRPIFAAMLGGPDRPFMLAPEWHGTDGVETQSQRKQDKCSSWTRRRPVWAGRERRFTRPARTPPCRARRPVRPRRALTAHPPTA